MSHEVEELAGLHNRTNSRIVPERQRYPFCLVWTPIPMLTWLFPFIGHMGIANSVGIIYDFAAAYTICEDRMAFGWPTMYCRLDLNKIPSVESWDKAVYEANEVYKGRVHVLCCDNCHSHVARALNGMQYRGRSNWNMFSVILLFFSNARYVSTKHCLVSLLPFLLLLILIIGIVLMATML